MDIEKEFIRWLSKGFKYDTAFAQEGAAKLYYAFVKQGEHKSFYKIPGFTKASLSRLRSKLIDDGIFYEMSTQITEATKEFSTCLIPLHPHPLIKWIAKHETYTEMTTLRRNFGEIIDALASAWEQNFGILFHKRSCFFPVVGRIGWQTPIAYGNLFGWLFTCRSQLQRVIVLTPHLKILRDPAFRETIQELAEQHIKFEFIAFENTKIPELPTDSLRLWTIVPEDNNVNVNLYTERGMVLINKGGLPFFGFEAKKIEETESYVGAVHVRCEEGHVQNILRALENLKSVAKPFQ